ncbi:MAG: dual specificity protein phosphatase family protein, partial [Nitrosopumilus sp.]|nr:dual specificity protein phosphatase family protein [Nitrosopumilus sp.]
LPTRKRSAITPELYLGGQYKLNSLNHLKKLGVTGIVNMRTRSIHTIAPEGIKVLHLPTPDHHAPTLGDLSKGVVFIKHEVEAGGKVYIHCRFGEGRGPTMAIAYLISTGLTLEHAIELVKKVRIFIRPTVVQIEQLKKFETLQAKE